LGGSYNNGVKDGGHCSIFLVGMMGAGKTTVARMLATRLNRTFVDCDHELEARCGVKVPVIFEIEGEAGFRAREAAIIDELTARPGIVLATGGGAILREENRQRLGARGLVIYLRAHPHDLHMRTKHDKNRPLLMTPDPRKRLEELFTQRDPLYREVADLVVDTGRQGVQVLVKQVLQTLAERWQVSA
jgi:shikimate kinase